MAEQVEPVLPESLTRRTAGLDTLRAIAIALVFAYHYRVFVSGRNTFGWASEVGWVGVDLFFVLSGYLIANPLLGGLRAGRRLSLIGFYLRRALRTWPAFWVVLVAYLLWPTALGGREPPPWWRFASFTQNIGLPPGTAFSHAWSLCIEEQFYLVLPLVALLASALARRVAGVGRWAFWLLLAVLTAVGVAARAVLWQRYTAQGEQADAYYHQWLYYHTLCRFDEFLPGVAVAFVRHFHPAAWAWLMRHGRTVLLAAALAAGLAMQGVRVHYYVEFDDGRSGYPPFMTIAGYSLIAWAFALAVVAALSPRTALHRWRIPGVSSLARWSYSIYLTHKAVAHVLVGWLATQAVSSGAVAIAIGAACLAVGWALYRVVEQPILARRERWVPGLFG